MRLLLVLLTLLSLPVFAQDADIAQQIQTSKTFGNYVVFYNAMPSTTLLPKIAAAYKIERGKNIAFINIAVRHRTKNVDEAQAVAISGTWSDLVHQTPLSFREIHEHDAIYYIAEVHYDNRALLRFDVQVTPQLKAGQPAPADTPFKVSFTRRFYTEP